MFSKLSPYKLAVQVLGVALVVCAVLTLFMSWSARGQQIASLERWQNTVVQATTAATVEPNAKGVRKTLDPDNVPAAIAGLKRSWDSCQAASAQRSTEAEQAKKRADNADAALAKFQVVLDGEYSSVSKRIAALAAAKAAPTPELQCQAVAADSKAAWEGWK